MRTTATIGVLGLVCFCVVGPVFAQDPGEEVSIALMEFSGKGGVSQDKADAMADLLAGEIASLGDVRLITRADIVSMLNFEAQKRLAGCDETECLSQVAGALEVRWLVVGNLSLFGETYLVNLKLIDVDRMVVVVRVSQRTRGAEERVLARLPDAVRDLFHPVAARLGLDMPGRVTVAARHPQRLGQSPVAVTVITREDVEASGATTIPDLLRMVPGMDVLFESCGYSAITARLYWTDENHHFLILIDGREVNVELGAAAVWTTFPISLDDVERIEVIRGAGSSLYGANAFAGVISITTRPIPERTSVEARVAGGEAGMSNLGVRAGTRIGDWGVSLSSKAENWGNPGEPRAASFRVWKVRSVSEYAWSDSRLLRLDIGLTGSSGPVVTNLGTFESDLGLRTVQLIYESDALRGQLYWTNFSLWADLDTPLEIGGVRLANLTPAKSVGNTLDLEVESKVFDSPDPPLLLIVGGGGRFSWVSSDDLLDAETYADPGSPDYHQAGLSHWELRGGAFVHAELAPAHWVTVIGDIRLDYNTETGEFASPRLAAVFAPADGQFVRLGGSRAFRKPSALEARGHVMVDFPQDSPIQGPEQQRFQEFMTRVLGNHNLDNEALWTLEAGYQGEFLDGQLSLALDLFFNIQSKRIEIIPDLVIGPQGLPDLEESRVIYDNLDGTLNIFGGELSVRWSPSRTLSLLAVWAHREVYDSKAGRVLDTSPKNLMTIGGRYRSESGVLASLYAHTRSEFWDRTVTNPAGLFEDLQAQHMDNVVLLLGKIGKIWTAASGLRFEAGLKLFLPVSPFSAPHFRYYEKGGGIDHKTGKAYGGIILARTLTAYIRGTY